MGSVLEGDVRELLGPAVAAHGLRRVLLVTDPGVRAAGHCSAAFDSLKLHGIDGVVYDDVRPNPDEVDVASCARVARSERIDGFVAVGGGSCIDAAKGANFVLTNGGQMRDYWGFDKAKLPLMPLFAVPTTAGTGSEVQSYALISHAETKAKMACGATTALPVVSILDPSLTLSLPREQTAITGLDAVVHAVETFVCTARTQRSMALSREAFPLLVRNLGRVLSDPNDVAARRAMLRGACLAGQAIEQSMLGAAHSAANPLTALFGVPHGIAVARMLPHVIRYNRQHHDIAALYVELAALEGHRDLAMHMEALLRKTAVRTLGSYGVNDTAITALSSAAAKQWTAQFNPCPIDEIGFNRLYQEVLSDESNEDVSG